MLVLPRRVEAHVALSLLSDNIALFPTHTNSMYILLSVCGVNLFLIYACSALLKISLGIG